MSLSRGTSFTTAIVLTSCALILLWVSAAFIGALHQVNWQVGELARQYMLATGMIAQEHTLVDFYTHIKGIEYLICVSFFVAFPLFVKYVNLNNTAVPVEG